MKRFPIIIALMLLSLAAVQAQLTFNVNDMLGLRRVADPRLSPDGKIVAFTVGTVDKAANRVVNQIHTIGVDGQNARQITNADSSSSGARWSPDGTRIAYNHAGQIWTMRPSGDDKKKITSLSTGASGPVWSRDGRWLAFVSDVYPECTSDACNKAEEEKAENSKVKAKVTERLLFKHWNEWRDRKRTHVFVIPSDGGVARDVTPGDFDSPPYSASSGVDYTFSPDGSSIVYLRNPDKVEATSTNSDIFILPLSGGAAKNITVTNRGYDVAPTYTPDGKYLLYRSQATPTFEADRWRIMRYDPRTEETIELTRGFDLQADEMVVSPDSQTVYFKAAERGRGRIFSVPVEPDSRQRIATQVRRITENDGYINGLNLSGDGSTFVSAGMKMQAPNEIMRVSSDGSGYRAITTINNAGLDAFRLAKPEEMEWRGAMNTTIHGFVVKPARFDPKKKYPLMVLIHGGPQSAWNDSWSYRWNPQIFASQGYVVFMPNPRGSTGYGQKFVNEISGDWGGKVYTDLMNGVAEIVKRPYIDKSRIGGAGASYGGYMVNWLLGHNNDPRFKFKAFLSHAGVYNLESMATSTEEIFFVNWDFKGMPWENPAQYNRWSPNKFARNFSTPTLVTAGELDYRVPVDQSLQLYTTLQLRGVESKLVIFPDEGHWILKPQNSVFWHDQVLGWFKEHLEP